ncbi:jg14051 [Pararge aegeria aegeria]|uniref:Jg14051 protein n=1 Tax=Pararge aegeria aegeria TaxID=348720 RepID=A0A8S4QYZ3_9NEOP|nr:jg14051 [Pararge aegeria aegeria]
MGVENYRLNNTSTLNRACKDHVLQRACVHRPEAYCLGVKSPASGEYFLPGHALHALYEGGAGAFLGDPGASQICAEDGHRGGFSG